MSGIRQGPDAAAGREAPVSLEQKLVAAFREHHVRRRTERQWMWSGLAAALAVAAAVTVVSSLWLRPKVVRAPAMPATPAAVAKVATAKPAAGRTLPVKPVAVARRVPRWRHRVREAAPEPRQEEVTTGFLPLDASGSPPASGAVVRVEVPRSTMIMFGLPVDEQRLSVPVRADVLLGEDGMAHAVRFVTTRSYEIQPGR